MAGARLLLFAWRAALTHSDLPATTRLVAFTLSTHMDSDGKNVRKLTNAPDCYNGGPFFSPDGKRVIFRADRQKN